MLSCAFTTTREESPQSSNHARGEGQKDKCEGQDFHFQLEDFLGIKGRKKFTTHRHARLLEQKKKRDGDSNPNSASSATNSRPDRQRAGHETRAGGIRSWFGKGGATTTIYFPLLPVLSCTQTHSARLALLLPPPEYSFFSHQGLSPHGMRALEHSSLETPHGRHSRQSHSQVRCATHRRRREGGGKFENRTRTLC